MKRLYPASSLLNLRKLRSLLSFGVKGYLAETGWIEAYNKKAPIDRQGNPIPWFTYGSIDFLEEKLDQRQSVFEFGSGNSTRYFAARTAGITSVEHDKDWYEQGLKNKPARASLVLCAPDEDGRYCRTPLQDGKKFDIIIIDGIDRVNCCIQSVSAVSEKGVIILDDSEREEYLEGKNYLKEHGFKELSFTGISPGFFYRKGTSIFYRPENCLNI